MLKNFKILLPIVVGFALVLASVATSFAWKKDGGASCESVFASIENLTEVRNWDGYVKANGVEVVTDGGVVQPHEWVSVSWTPTAGFTGSVEAYVRVLYNHGATDDFSMVVDQLDCGEVNPTPTPNDCLRQDCEEASPSATPEATASSTTSTGGGDNNSSSNSTNAQVAGATTNTPEVLASTGTRGYALAFAGFSMILVGLWQVANLKSPRQKA